MRRINQLPVIPNTRGHLCELLDIFSVVGLNKLLNKQLNCWRFETPRCCDITVMGTGWNQIDLRFVNDILRCLWWQEVTLIWSSLRLSNFLLIFYLVSKAADLIPRTNWHIWVHLCDAKDNGQFSTIHIMHFSKRIYEYHLLYKKHQYHVCTEYRQWKKVNEDLIWYHTVWFKTKVGSQNFGWKT